MTETLHWYAETSGGVQTGNCTVTENGGALHLTADLPAGTLKAVRAELVNSGFHERFNSIKCICRNSHSSSHAQAAA